MGDHLEAHRDTTDIATRALPELTKAVGTGAKKGLDSDDIVLVYITGTTQNTQRRRHAQSLDKDSLQLPRPTFAVEQERSLKYQKEHPHPVP
jgi:hypothetical protein